LKKSEGSNSSASNSHNKSPLNAQKRISVSKLTENAEAINNSNISFGENEEKFIKKDSTKEKSSEPKLLLEENINVSLTNIKLTEKLKIKYQNFKEKDTKSYNALIQRNKCNVANNNNFDNGGLLNKVMKKIKNIFEISKCGFQGVNIEKTNQDNFAIEKNILNEKDTYFFAVL